MLALPKTWIQIDSKTQQIEILGKYINTNLILVCNEHDFGVNYIFTALGNTYHSDTPYFVSDNSAKRKVPDDLKVNKVISKCSKTDTIIRFHIKATAVKIIKFTVFESELFGNIPNTLAFWSAFEDLKLVDKLDLSL